MSISLTYLMESELPSQAGKRGRPRKAGRASVVIADASNKDVQKQVLAALASQYDVEPASLVRYARECSADTVTFVIPSLNANIRAMWSGSQVYIAIGEPSTVPAAEDAPASE